jgi:hypothetical protein
MNEQDRIRQILVSAVRDGEIGVNAARIIWLAVEEYYK